METEFKTLSERIKDGLSEEEFDNMPDWINAEDVKEFIKRLKDKFTYMPHTRIHYGKDILEEIDKLAGKELTK
jgi:hypothetical protein